MGDARWQLNRKIEEMRRINEILRDEIFSIIGIPRESWAPGPNHIVENLLEIKQELQKIRHTTQNENHQLNNCINKLQNAQKSQQESEILSDISQLFD